MTPSATPENYTTLTDVTVQAADDDIREFIAEQFAALLEERDFDYFLDGNIRGPAGRSDIVRQRFVDISRNGRR
jgi:hypothetical protein